MSDGKIFISYRRADVPGFARLLFDRLGTRFGEENIFMDVEGIDPGEDFVELLDKSVGSCDVLLALIGPQWLTIADRQGRRRLDNPEDFVRLEIATALTRNIRVIPILVQNAQMPVSDELPAPLQRLSRLNAIEIRHERFNADVDRLAVGIENYLAAEKDRRNREVQKEAMHEKSEREQQENAVTQHAAQIAEYLASAKAAQQGGDWEAARNHYQQILAMQPEHAAAQAGLQVARDQLELASLYGQALLNQDEGRLEQALHIYRQVQAKDTNYADVAERIANIETAIKQQIPSGALPATTTESHQNAASGISRSLQNLPRWGVISGGFLILIIFVAVAYWGSQTLLNGSETPQLTKTNLAAAGQTPLSAAITVEQKATATLTPSSIATFTIEPGVTFTPAPTEIFPVITDSFGVSMALVPVGAFEMGSTDGYDTEKPIHTVTLENFYIDQYEVTNAHYAECVAAGKCDPPDSNGSYTRNSYYDNTDYADYPVIYVSWEDASAYCAWREARLPTEAEWEKAARGGLESESYPWGNTFDGKLANYCDVNCTYSHRDVNFDDGFVETAPIGMYPPNGYELFDMAGNVKEWIADWYDVYPGGDPQASDYFGKSWRVVRGGSWDGYSDFLRVAFRSGFVSISSYRDLGFRCVRSVAP